ncbi:adenylate kinase [Acidithiobacillus sp. CV18-2]|uniref:Adenylate kinase n=1 Tax=Igneacidithiobacillus copahuensis TaxID=2724909 RepID=A0AAE2YMN3_9PROT|nr:adenylate kinase [Igneacidithiobacillus copahuensis]MBU2753999.1 adenylate kinase [Acidithiobacillus sp. CV18-3]MBU2756227.1 adenylate kinase [Acidithiobacillus sp. BN09-2]MBU2778672.1 adenylate kinase [Acidithiobacillus sp. CV18-2]MBU2797239.1 adenylate kinase [Acidithiobacillus sp. VAN18-2]MBU2798872.1 adenylate kinase [Acidithiobacillus sp. VAN18-4]UTV81413.1 adenylate kinase [Acidithiobacillus sp. YTS05]
MTYAGHIILLGAPGVGKGTQAKVLSAELGLPHVSTGDMLRASVAAGSEMGKRAKAVMESGALVSDEIILGIVSERLQECDAQKGVVFDGFPRTVVQAEGLDHLLARSVAIAHVLHIVLDDEEIVDRLSGRRVCRNCGAIYHVRFQPPKVAGRCDRCGGELFQRDDDQPEVIRHRLAVYAAETAPLVSFYRARAGYAEVDGTGSSAAVTDRIRVLLR